MSREPNALLTPNRPSGGQRHPALNAVKGRSIAERRRTRLFCLARNARSAGENNRGLGLVSLGLSFRFKASTRVLGFWDRFMRAEMISVVNALYELTLKLELASRRSESG